MATIITKSPLVSKCCKALVSIKPDKEFYHSEQEAQITMWHECTACGKPCDVEEVEDEKIR
jgi:hypothetical protein